MGKKNLHLELKNKGLDLCNNYSTNFVDLLKNQYPLKRLIFFNKPL